MKALLHLDTNKIMIKKILLPALCAISLISCNKENKVNIYVTTGDKSQEMVRHEVSLFNANKIDKKNTKNLIKLNPSIQYQEIDGFGAAITGSTAHNLLKMTKEDRYDLLKQTFDPVDGNGYSYIRISIGASDFSLDEYTYCDSVGIENFAIHDLDKKELFPILKEIKKINPNIKIMGSPWTPPKWMKVNNLTDLKPYDSWTSGQLNPKYYQDYAQYFVNYLKEMEKEGFPIDAITIQNEPLNRGNSVSLFMTWQEQRDFIKDALGPAFEKNNIKTKIIAYDHNYDYDNFKEDTKDQMHYPVKIYEDSIANKYIDGSAFHAYGGDKKEMGYVHDQYPDKNLYFTEMSIGMWGEGYKFDKDLMWNMREVGIGTLNNYNKAIMMWNLMLDDKYGPWRPGGCDICLGSITIDSNDYKTLEFNSHYYTMAHLSKVIHQGAHRIESSGEVAKGIYFATFQNPNKTYSIVMMNENEEPKTITVQCLDKAFEFILPARSIDSAIWK